MTVVEKKLANQSFIDNAPESVVKHEKQKLLDMNDEFDIIKTNLDIFITELYIFFSIVLTPTPFAIAKKGLSLLPIA